jgi:hypothetical protein
MKKLFSLLLVVGNLNCFAQANKWFVSFSAAPTIGGPSSSIKKQFVSQGFDQTSSFNFLGLEGTTKYPVVMKDASLLIRGGAKLNDHRSIYFTVGQSAAGTVEGYKNEGYSDFLGIFGGSYGQTISIDYHTYQFTAGYMYSFPNTRSKVGFGPSFFLFDYAITENNNSKGSHTALSPGATFTARLPLGKERKLFGVELVFEGNAALPVKMKSEMEGAGFQPGTVNMFSANIGIAFCFRK